ncbi:hypothetical protein [Methanosarcina mazei]|nr:hypothetical protein [Methanosarcina mazei]MDO5839924.1 hypothetical protein [Methanosarcina mazei]
MSFGIGSKLQMIVQLLQQVLENAELVGGVELQNGLVCISGRYVCVSE